jgi:hypothetical protein
MLLNEVIRLVAASVLLRLLLRVLLRLATLSAEEGTLGVLDQIKKHADNPRKPCCGPE